MVCGPGLALGGAIARAPRRKWLPDIPEEEKLIPSFPEVPALGLGPGGAFASFSRVTHTFLLSPPSARALGPITGGPEVTAWL